MQVERLAAAGQGSRGTPGAIRSACHKNFPYMVPSILQELTSYKTRSRKNGNFTINYSESGFHKFQSDIFLKMAKQT